MNCGYSKIENQLFISSIIQSLRKSEEYPQTKIIPIKLNDTFTWNLLSQCEWDHQVAEGEVKKCTYINLFIKQIYQFCLL